MSEVNEVNGLILFSKKHRDKDKLVKIFTEQHGKVMFFMRNAMKKNNPLTVATQPFAYGTYIGKLNQEGLSFLNASKNVGSFRHIQQDIFLTAYATYILNLVDVAIDDQTYDPALYGFTRDILTLMDEGQDPEILTNIFEIQILNRFGLEFEWIRCRICGQTQGKFDFSSAYLGVICEQDFHRDERRYHASAKAMHFIRMFSSISLEQIHSISLSPETKREIRQTIDMLYEEYVGIFLKSKKFIDDMVNWQNILLDKRVENSDKTSKDID
ncbi:DNA repair protein RecO [Vagococcus xieshaowenii]|uniref:DNA repair protein RecO n=1 Tax=Vagococcus xieshaowenii TaxID=2562451 RepID=A0AAJ5EH32_9ENTE|nr:DNA repair protein RecO [Vagococcus xieshaowenii]QCA28831.1 DNA repair protein RecO [Vagococcus xieshaowenii]TFZ43462.1 DNA repair protein RecO [Vagococcus xieshaowenii]